MNSALPEKPPTLLKLAADLFEDPAEQAAFADAVLKIHPYRPALAWLGDRPDSVAFRVEPPAPWQPSFVDRLRRDQRPGQTAWHDEGRFYCLTFSSVFECAVFGNLSVEHPQVVDLCAAPGGKSVMAARHLSPARLVSNEVVGKRTAPLIANLRRCRVPHAAVTSLDTAVIAEQAPAAADLVIVDAPCSGQSMIAKGKQVADAFHNRVVNHNRNRQRRILLHAARIVKPGGLVAYMTCTYAEKENEDNLSWLRQHRPELVPEKVPALADAGFQSHLADFPCYRMWPHHGNGVGGFTSLLRHTGDPADSADPAGTLDNLNAVWNSPD